MKPSKKSPNSVKQMQELADLAGVSRSTVSRALSNSPLINDKTKAKIRKLAKKHNYRINEKARNFRLQKTNIITVVMMLDIESGQHMSDPFFLDILGGIADALAQHNYDLLLAHAPIHNLLDLPDSRTFQQSDGVIFVGQGKQHENLNLIAELDTPIIVWGANLPDKKYSIVASDNVNGGILATTHLIETGRKRIAFFGDIEQPELAQRYEGYKQALNKHGLKIDEQLVVDVPFEMQHARETLTELIESNNKFDAVFCCTDVIALSAIATLNEHSISVPKDVSIVGYDDISMASYSNPPLTTVRQNIRWAGRVLVDSILSKINGETIADTIIQSELIVRKSSVFKSKKAT